MKLVSIEPTPNPNSMKLNLDESLADGVSLPFARESAATAPAHLRALLGIAGVKSVYQTADFIALERFPHADWQRILAGVHDVFEQAGDAPPPQEPPGKVNVLVQMLRGIPMQIKLLTGDQDVRVALPERFGAAARQVAMAADLLAERRWAPRGVRYGDVQEVGEAVAAEVAAAYDEGRLQQLLEQALHQGPGEAVAAEPLPPAEVARRLADPAWQKRYAALEQLEPAPEALDVVVQALGDAHQSVRRLATVYLGQIGLPEVLPHLVRMLQDPFGAVRRAAGDCLSDLGDPAAIGPMAAALRDPSKLVRWRAARFLYEVGDESALPALRAAENDPEFEVALQVRMAIERIEAGRGVVEPAWKQMIREWDKKSK